MGLQTNTSNLPDFELSAAEPTNGQTLIYNSATGKWVPTTPEAGGGDTVEESEFVGTFQGGDGPVTCYIRKFGKTVVLEISEFGGTSDGNPVETSNAIPLALRPRQWLNFNCFISDNDVAKIGVAFITTDGTLRIGNQVGANLAAGDYYVNAISMTWTLA